MHLTIPLALLSLLFLSSSSPSSFLVSAKKPARHARIPSDTSPSSSSSSKGLAPPSASSSSWSSVVSAALAQEDSSSCIAHCPMTNNLLQPISSQDHLAKGGLHCGYRSTTSPFPTDCFYSPLGGLLSGPVDACPIAAPKACRPANASAATSQPSRMSDLDDLILNAPSTSSPAKPKEVDPSKDKDCIAHCPMTNSLLQPIASQDHPSKGGLHCGYKPTDKLHPIDCYYDAIGRLTSGPFGACAVQAPMACDRSPPKSSNNAQTPTASIATIQQKPKADKAKPSAPAAILLDALTTSNVTHPSSSLSSSAESSTQKKPPPSTRKYFQNRPSSKHSKRVYGPNHYSFLQPFTRRSSRW